MPDMREPYAYVIAEADRMECEAKHARHKASRLIAEAEVLEVSAIKLRNAIREQMAADKSGAEPDDA